MEHNCIIVRYGELGLKGKNRIFFENKLVDNMHTMLKSRSLDAMIVRKRGRIIVYSEKDTIPILKNVFGIKSLSYAIEIKSDFEEMKKKSLEFISSIKFDNFRASCQRIDKRFPIEAPVVERELGAYVVEKLGKKVKLKDPELNLQIEIADLEKSYILLDRVKAQGGLPMGIAGKVLCLLQDKASLLAAYLMMKRGCRVIAVELNDVELDLSGLRNYDYMLRVEETKGTKDIDAIAKKLEAKAIIVSDTLDDMRKYDFNTMVLAPLVCYEKEEIEESLKEHELI